MRTAKGPGQKLGVLQIGVYKHLNQFLLTDNGLLGRK